MKLLLDQGLPRSTGEILAQVISQAGAELVSGAAVSVTEGRIHVRLLPIRR